MTTVWSFLIEWAGQTRDVVLEASPWLLAGFFLAGLLHAWIPVHRIAAHLGGSGAGSVLKAALLGAPLPLCSCSVIPVASALRRRGASKAATAGFLISTPETGVDSVSVTYALLGPAMAVIRPVAAVLTAVVAGLTIRRLDPDPPPRAGSPEPREPAPSCCGRGPSAVAPSYCGGESGPQIPVTRERPDKTTAGRRLREGLAYGFLTMFTDLGHWLALGFVLAGLVSAALPPGLLEGRIAAGPAGMALAILVALPIYVCATASTPIAAALIAKGLSPGTALVFLLVGPATNATTMVVVARELGRRCLLIYVASIVAVALACGLLTDLLLAPAGGVLPADHSGCHERTPGHWLAGLVLTGLILNGMRRRFVPRGTAATDMAPGPLSAHLGDESRSGPSASRMAS